MDAKPFLDLPSFSECHQTKMQSDTCHRAVSLPADLIICVSFIPIFSHLNTIKENAPVPHTEESNCTLCSGESLNNFTIGIRATKLTPPETVGLASADSPEKLV